MNSNPTLQNSAQLLRRSKESILIFFKRDYPSNSMHYCNQPILFYYYCNQPIPIAFCLIFSERSCIMGSRTAQVSPELSLADSPAGTAALSFGFQSSVLGMIVCAHPYFVSLQEQLVRLLCLIECFNFMILIMWCSELGKLFSSKIDVVSLSACWQEEMTSLNATAFYFQSNLCHCVILRWRIQSHLVLNLAVQNYHIHYFCGEKKRMAVLCITLYMNKYIYICRTNKTEYFP